MKPIISLRNVDKIFGTYISRARVTSLRNISLDIYPGERVCLFGPNGAGKSTIMKVILGLVKPSNGEVFVKGMRLKRNKLRIKQMIGYLPSELSFFEDTACRETLFHFAILRGQSREQAREEVKQLLDLIGLAKWDDLPPSLMSSGMRQRFSLALTLIGDPEIILFDEPVSFIDVQGKMKIYELMEDYVKNTKKTIIMCTHEIQDAMIMSDRMVFLDRGEIIMDGPIADIVNKKCRAMEIILAEDKPSEKQIEIAIGTEDYDFTGRKIIIKAPKALDRSTQIVNRLRANNIPVFSYRPYLEQKRKKNVQDEQEVAS
ncbi:MAG: ABC transporter ATP-binding protein [Asgard group archaeon]|nr:ABC transporter ATP-binding protein [Asgard group archaeon]